MELYIEFLICNDDIHGVRDTTADNKKIDTNRCHHYILKILYTIPIKLIKMGVFRNI